MEALNYIVVTLYGTVIMLMFDEVKKKKEIFFELLILNGLFAFINVMLYKHYGHNAVKMFYPLTVHLPLMLYFVLRLKIPFRKTLFSLTTAYMLTMPRKWICDFLGILIGSNFYTNIIIEIPVTILFIWIIHKFIAPLIVRTLTISKREVSILCIAPMAFYLGDYCTTVYSDILYKYPTITIGFLTSGYALFFTMFVIFYLQYTREKMQNKNTKELLNLQYTAINRISEHLTCEKNYYCEWETLNALLTMYATLFKRNGSIIICNCDIKRESESNTSDLPVILSVVLDDVLTKVKEFVDIEICTKNNQLCVMIECDYVGICNESTQKIVGAVVENRKGIMTVNDKNHLFIMKIAMKI